MKQKEEVEAVEMWTREEIFAKEKSGVKITPDTLVAFRLMCDKGYFD